MNNNLFRRRLGLILIATVTLRVAFAMVDLFHPLLPAYNYTDARIYSESAQRYLRSKSDPSTTFSTSEGKELYTIWTAILYRVFGASELAPRIFNAIFASGSVLAWALIAGRLFTPATGLTTGLMLCFWPSHAFYSGQHLKEALNMLLLPCALGFALKHLDSNEPIYRRWTAFELFGGAMSLALLGFIRSILLPPIAASFCVGALWIRENARARFLAVFSSIIFGILFYHLAHSLTRARFNTDHNETRFASIPTPRSQADKTPARFTPQWVSHVREQRQRNSQVWAERNAARRIETQILPGVRFDTWIQVAAFAPKAMFYVLFMPLPGIYPLDGKLSRVAAAIENIFLLAASLMAAACFRRDTRSPAKTTLIVLFLAFTIPSSIFEFDLGSATRHKLHYFPLLLPFAAHFLTARLMPLCRRKSV